MKMKKLMLKDLKVESFITNQREIKGGLDRVIDGFDSGKRDCDTEKYICGTV